MDNKTSLRALPNNAYARKFVFILMTICNLFLCSNVLAVEEEISWSSANKAITDTQLKTAVSSAVIDVTNEDFSTYSYSYQYNSYDYLLNNYISNDTYSKAFISSGEDGFYLLTSYNKFQLNYRNAGYPYNEHYYGFNSTNMYYFDINNKTISSVNFGGNYAPLNSLGWDFAKTDITINEFETVSYKQNMIYETFFLVLGPIYDDSDTTRVLNSTRSYKVDGNMYEGLEYTGEIVFSDKFETWQTRNLSETFTSGEYYYFIDAFYYDENGVSASNVGTTQRIGEGTVTFNGDSVYLPSVVEVNKAIKQFDGYMNYAYNIVLTKVGSDNELFLSSDLFIVDAKPIVMIPYFRYKYNYIYYGNYIDIGESGDNGSGDNNENNTITSGDIQQATQGGIISGLTDYFGGSGDADFEDKQYTSGEILEKIDFKPIENPNANFWFELTNIINNALTGNAGQVVFKWFGKEFTITPNQIVPPYPNELKILLNTVSTVVVIFIIAKWVKIIADTSQEGNLDKLLEMNEEGIVNLF